ncbi:MAG: polyprenol monophosphomannose synthase [Anaerolineales bacterium]
MSSITIVIPTYNEAENLPILAAELWALQLDNLHILVVDDASPDGTGQVADDLSARQPQRLQVIHRTGKLGLGTAYLTGFQAALDSGAEIVGQMDADFSHSPSFLPDMLDALEEADAVIGSRYVEGGEIDERWGIGRLMLSSFGNLYARTILGLRARDATGGFRLWRRGTLLGMPLDRVRSNGYVFQVEITYIAERLGYRLAERPIYFEERRLGQSKMSLRIQLEAAIRVWQLLFKYRDLQPAPAGRRSD